MKSVLVLAAFAAFAAVADSSVVPFYDTSDSPEVTFDCDDPSANVTFSYDQFSIPSPTDEDISTISPTRRNLFVGSIAAADRRLLLVNVNRPAVAGVTLIQNITYRNANIRIRAVRAFQVRQGLGANPIIVSGGVGQSAVHVRITSVRGGPIFYQVEIWGR